MAPRAKTTTPVDPVEAAAKRATIPTRPVIEHTKLFRAELVILQQTALLDLAQVDHVLMTAVDECETAQVAAARAEELAIAAAAKARKGADELATQRLSAIRKGADKERADIIRKLDAIERALNEPAPAEQADETEPNNVVQIAAE